MNFLPLTPTYQQHHELYNFDHVTHVGYDSLNKATAITFSPAGKAYSGDKIHVKESVKTIYEMLQKASNGGVKPLHITTSN